MKLLDKIKDLFMDEVTDDDELEIEDELEEEKEEMFSKNELPKVMRETIKREEKPKVKTDELVKEEKKESVSDFSNKKFSFPINMEDEIPSRNSRTRVEEVKKPEPAIVKEEKRDIKREISLSSIPKTRNTNINVLNLEKDATKKVSELYPRKSEDKNVKPKFKASPVISPVYGVLDKNYTKEEVKERTEDTTTMKRPSKKVDFETVRKKAFGNLADEIKDNLLCENCELYKEVKKISALKEDDLLYDMTVDDEPEEKELTIEKAYDDYEEFGVAYEPKVEKKKVELEDTTENKLDDIIINNNETTAEKESFSSIKSKVDEDEYSDEDIKEVVKKEEEIPSRTEKKKETKVDADFFELIDSMYKERTDD